MDPQRWRQIESILDTLLDLPAGERDALLERTCRGDPSLRAEVARYLAACEDAEGQLELPSLDGISQELEGDPPPEESGVSSRAPDAPGAGRQDPSPGGVIGAYRILRLLGRGGMGAVYLAERADGAFHRRVALKLVKRGMDSEEILARFQREREILARLQHPNIAHLLDGGITDDGLPYFVMELVEGEPIDQWCDGRALGVEARTRLFLSVCEAVRYAHSTLVVHRDLKPGNILVHEGEARLLDFGIAKLLQEEAGTGATALYGPRLTPAYAAPEQLRGEPASTTVDVYALGVILFELLTGELPHPRDRESAPGIRGVVETDPRVPSEVLQGTDRDDEASIARVAAFRGLTPAILRQRLRGDLDAILLQALAWDPERRYSSVEALVQDLERHLAGLPVQARPDSRWYRASRFVRRNRSLVGVGAVAVLALIGGSVATTTLALLANQERDRRQLEAERATAARDFVVDLFAELDPDLGGSRSTFTRQELIDLGARGLEDLQGQPELRAGVLNTLGQVALNLGDRDRAEEFFREALELLREGPPEPELAASMMGLGEVLRAELRFVQAEEWLAGALELRETLLPQGDPRIAESRAALALALYNQGPGRFEEAEVIYQELLDAGSALPVRVRASALAGFANLRLGQGRYPEAEALYDEAMEVRRTALGGLDPGSARLFWGLGHARRLQGKLDDAEGAYREALGLHTSAYGPHHANVAWGHYNLAGVLEERGELAPAAEAYRLAAELMEELHQPGYLYTAFAWQGVGRVEALRGRSGAAEEGYLRALEGYRLAPADDEAAQAERIAGIHLALGEGRALRGEVEGAERELRIALDLFRGDAQSPEGAARAAAALAALSAVTSPDGS